MTLAESWENLARSELVARAEELGVERPDRMTRLELKDEILRRTRSSAEQLEARGLFGIARAMVANVMERGLNLPDAAALLRGTATFGARVEPRAAVATVTLAEIYAAQGHRERALSMIERVLADEPDHVAARRLRDELTAGKLVPDREGATAAASTDYEPAPTLETTGEEIRTGEPPAVAPLESPPAESMAAELPVVGLPAAELPVAELTAAELPVVELPVAELPVVGPAGDRRADAVLDQASPAERPAAGAVRTASLHGALVEGLMTLEWTLPGAEPTPDSSERFFVTVVAFERSLGAPLRQEARFPLTVLGRGASSGTLTSRDFAGASVCAALGVLDERGVFVPIAPSVALHDRHPALSGSGSDTLP